MYRVLAVCLLHAGGSSGHSWPETLARASGCFLGSSREHGPVQAGGRGGQGHWLWNWADLDCNPAPACVTLDQLLVLSEAQFPQLLNK